MVSFFSRQGVRGENIVFLTRRTRWGYLLSWPEVLDGRIMLNPSYGNKELSPWLDVRDGRLMLLAWHMAQQYPSPPGKDNVDPYAESCYNTEGDAGVQYL